MALKSIDSIVSNIVSKVSIVSKRGGWLDMALPLRRQHHPYGTDYYRLPTEIRMATTLDIFQSKLKTYLFPQYYD